MSRRSTFPTLLFALIVVSMAFSGCIHEPGQVDDGAGRINGLSVYEVVLTPSTPLTNLTIMVPLPYRDGVSVVADAIEHGEEMSVPPGWSIMIIDGDDAVFLKIDADKVGICDNAASSGEVDCEPMTVFPGNGYTENTACRFRIVVPDRISVPDSSLEVNNPLLYPKTDIHRGNENISGSAVPPTRVPALSYLSIVYAGYDAPENARLDGHVTVSGAVPGGLAFLDRDDPGFYKTVYTDELVLDLAGQKAGWHPVNGTVTYLM